MNLSLTKLDKPLKRFLISYLLVLTIGVSVGLVFVSQTTKLTPAGTVERFKGSENFDVDSEQSMNYSKSLSEMLMTTHNHIIGFSFIFFTLGFIFYFNSIIKGWLKNTLLIEPFISVIFSFSSIWGMKYIAEGFIYITIVSAVLMYLSLYAMVFVSLYELVFKK